MQFDPRTKTLYTDHGERIKTLYCPLRMAWEELEGSSKSPHRNCASCERDVLDTAQFTDEELLAIVRADPETCLCVRARQANVTILTHRP
jgi:hypothetical protein